MTPSNLSAETTGLSDAAFARISSLAKSEAGLILPKSKITMVQSRLRHRMSAIGLPTYDTYAEYVTSTDGATERRHMISALTTNVSHFFRENHHFNLLRDQALPGLQAKARAGHPIRIWSAGCSSGQEPYSIAMLLLEHAPDLVSRDMLILATDIDPNILEKAESGLYSEQQIGGVPDVLKKKYLKQGAAGYTIDPIVKRLVRFRELNLLRDWPMRNRFDAIFCRNVVIYFDAATQEGLWPRFENALQPDGWFFLGHSERVSDSSATRFMSVGMTAYRPKNAKDTTKTLAKEN